MNIDYIDLLNGRKDKDIEEPFQDKERSENLIRFRPRKQIFKHLVKIAENLDYFVYVGNPPFPHIMPAEQKLVMPTLKRCRWNNVLFFSIFIHELTHILPYETRVKIYNKHEEEIICELTAVRFLENITFLYFNERRYKETRNRIIKESMQYIKRHINRANRSSENINYIDKKRLKNLVQVSLRRYNYLAKRLRDFDES